MKFIPLAAKINAQKTIQGFPINQGEITVDQIFVMSPNVALEVEKLSLSKDFSVDPSDLRIPYPKVFVELPITDEIKALRRPVGAVPIVRVGAYIESMSEGMFRFWPSWEFKDGSLGFGLVSLIVNAPDEQATTAFKFGPSVDAPLILLQAEIADPVKRLYRQQRWSEEDATARLQQILANDQTGISEVIEEMSPLLLAWSLIINCKTGVTKTYVKRVKPKAAGKRSAILNGTSYTVVTLNALETVDSSGVISARTDLTAHYVRGHFKKRSTGIFWWQPFVRGKGPIRRREAYFVRETEEEGVPA